jgi:hypothetical protein
MAKRATGGGGISPVRVPRKSTAGSTTGKAVSRGAGRAVGGGGNAKIRNPGKNKSLGGGHPSGGGFSAKHVSVTPAPPGRK